MTGLLIDNDLLSGSLLAVRSWDIGPVTLSAGAEAGAFLLRQRYAVDRARQRAVRGPVSSPGDYRFIGERLSAETPTSWSRGALLAPLLQLELPLRARGYVRLEAALPTYFGRIEGGAPLDQPNAENGISFTWDPTLRLLAAAGFYF